MKRQTGKLTAAMLTAALLLGLSATALADSGADAGEPFAETGVGAESTVLAVDGEVGGKPWDVFAVTWKNADGTVLETDENVSYGTTPSYDGETPTRAATPYYSFAFSGWTPEISEVEGDVTYTATYHATTIPASDDIYDGMEIGTRDESAGPLRIAIMTDAHVPYFSEWAQKPQSEVLADCITDAKAKGAEKILVTGDLTSRSLEEEYQLYHDTVAAYAGDTEVIESIGNHELRYTVSGVTNRRNELRNSLGPRWRNSMGTGLYYSQWIGNTHVVALGCDTYSTDVDGQGQLRLLCPTKAQVDWFERIVEEDYQNGVTTIVMCHQPIKDTTQGSTEYWSSPTLEDRVKDIISSHDNVILFSGHTHAGGSSKYIYQAEPGSGVMMHAGRIYQTSGQPVYVLMDELETGDRTRSYTLSYVFPDKVVPVYTFTHTGPKYTVTWKNADGTVLEIDENVPYGTTPTYDGETPEKASDAYRYTFAGWDSEPAAATGDATYTATYDAAFLGVAESGGEYAADVDALLDSYLTVSGSGDRTITLWEDVTVASGGMAVLSASGRLDLNGRTLTLERGAALAAFGEIVDTKGGGRLVLTDGNYYLCSAADGSMALRDRETEQALGAAAVYAFYAYATRTWAPVPAENKDAVTFWLRLSLEDAEAYGLLSGGWADAGLRLTLRVDCERFFGGSSTFTFEDDFLARYAAAARLDPGKAISVTISRLAKLRGAAFTVTPVLEVGGTPITMEARSYTYPVS